MMGVSESKFLLLSTSFIAISLIVSSFVINALSGKRFLFSANTYFLTGFVVFIIIGMLKSVWIYDQPVTNDISILGLSCVSVILSLFCYLLAYHIPSTLASRKRFTNVYELSLKKILRIILVLGLLGGIGLLFYNPLSTVHEIDNSTSIERFSVNFTIVSGILAFFLFMNSRKNLSRVNNILVIAVLLFGLGTVLFRGSRFVYLFLYSFLMLYYLYDRIYIKRKVIKLSGAVTIVFALFIVIIVANVTKTFAVLGWKTSEVEVDAIQVAALSRMLSFEFVDAFDNLTLIVAHYEKTGEYINGMSLLTPIVNVIPRSIWNDKPAAFGTMFVEKVYGGIPGLSLAPSLTGELIANYGFVALIVGFLVFGFLCKFLDHLYVINQGDPSYMVVHIPLLYLMLMENRGDFFLNTAVLYIILPLFLIKRYIVTRRRAPI
ncbi:MAG: oligosaccharide repeat unit polymerase [Gammaproteobacteria bacterium]|nr:oligosaccharide repeat unit polymerase [Gammaproteobacteria bacterium]MDH5799267.1 oligosaccharide repeat unit polymerase [Gammaproteobacteria bacterium]